MKYKFFLVAKFLAFSLLFFIFAKGGINQMIFPFAFPLLFALAWANQKLWILIPSYLIGYLLANLTFSSVICAITCISVLAVAYYIHIHIKKPIAKWELFVLAFFSQSANIVFDIF